MTLLSVQLTVIKIHLVIERIYPDLEHSNTVLPKLEEFWRICILPEILGKWFIGRCDMHASVCNDNGICFCRGPISEPVVSCSNVECPYEKFQIACLSLSKLPTLKSWYCPHCCRLSQFKKSRRSTKDKQPAALNQAAMFCSSICICNTKATPSDRLVESGTACENGTRQAPFHAVTSRTPRKVNTVHFSEENRYFHVQNHHTKSLELCIPTLVLAYFGEFYSSLRIRQYIAENSHFSQN